MEFVFRMEKRYHVHVCYATDDLMQERSIMMQKLAERCFFTFSLHDNHAVANNYSRHQIDSCDYVFFLVGKEYGRLAASGVSYLHLDFIYANTKQKKILTLVSEMSNNMPSLDAIGKVGDSAKIYNKRKLVDFRRSLLNDCDNYHVFSSRVDFAGKVMAAFSKLTDEHPARGWVPYERKTEIKPKITKAPEPDDAGYPQDTAEFVALGFEEVSANDSFTCRYSAHAYTGGNLKEVFLEKTLIWGDLLNIVADNIRMPASEDNLIKLLNDFLEKTALQDIKPKMPGAHAATRCQIISEDAYKIKLQLLSNNWVRTAGKTSNGKSYFILTPGGARQVSHWRSVIEKMKTHT